MFDWIRRSVKNAVLAGVNEAIAELAGASPQPVELPEPVHLLLPAPESDDAPKARKVKAS